MLACQQRWQVIQRDSAVPVRDQEAIASDVGTQQLSETTTLEPLAVDETGKLSQLLQGAVITAPEPSASSEVQNTTILAQPNSLRQPASVLLTETTGEDIDATSKNPDLAKPILIVDDNNVNLKVRGINHVCCSNQQTSKLTVFQDYGSISHQA